MSAQPTPKRKREPLPEPEAYREEQTAVFLGVSRRCLQQWRQSQQGPPYVKLGPGRMSPVRYLLRDLRKWLEENTVRQSA